MDDVGGIRPGVVPWCGTDHPIEERPLARSRGPFRVPGHTCGMDSLDPVVAFLLGTVFGAVVVLALVYAHR